MSLEIKVGPFTLDGEPGGHVDVWDEINRIAAKVPSAHVGPLAEALLAFVVAAPAAAPAPSSAAKRPEAVECRTYHALMFWAVTPAGRKMPMDVKPDPAGDFVLALRAGELHLDKWRADESKHAPPRRRYTSHFVTCPQAEQHRRAR